MITLSDGRGELFQWDTDVYVTVPSGVEEVHYSNKHYGEAVVAEVIDGKAIIPPEFLQIDKPLNVWGFVPTQNGGYTKVEKTFGVKRKNKPSNYVYTPTEQITLRFAVDTASEAKQIAESVEQRADNGEFKGDKGDKGDDYVLTEMDKMEIAQIALELLPDGDEVAY